MPSSDAETKLNSALANAVRDRFGPRCPCCGNPMHDGRVRKKNARAQNRRDRASVAHDVPVSMGGNATLWVWACRGCNNDQGAMAFAFWAIRLELDGDPRAARVVALAEFIRQWADERGIQRMLRRSAV